MSTAIAPKYAIGDRFYIPTTNTEMRKLDCPDCLGEKTFKAIAPSGDTFTIDCPRCSGSAWMRDVPDLQYHHHVPNVIECEIAGYCVNEYGQDGIKYRAKGGQSVSEDELISDRAVAEASAEAMAADRNAKAEATPERIHHAHLGSLKLKEASHDQFKSGLYDSWVSFRHLREAVDEIINDEGNDYHSRSEIVDHLEGNLSTTHRYDFVFKGYTRVMEAVVALVNADDDKAPEVLAALRKLWINLPEDAQKAWTPNERIATDWSGKPCPTY